ncbi:MAG: DUF2784 domain-containing protein, partial [Nitrospira sp.]|nr:DUF2784 domain-containing protein [Nitrospira sp.]
IHVTAAVWGAIVEFTGWICPLTPLEQFLRVGAGSLAYETDFIGHYLLPLLYPAALTRDIQPMLGMIVIGVNVALYGWIWRRKKMKNRP